MNNICAIAQNGRRGADNAFLIKQGPIDTTRWLGKLGDNHSLDGGPIRSFAGGRCG
jgi:hypothetical protein